MTYHEYQQLFVKIINNPEREHPYSHDDYFNYTKLNQARMRRWDHQQSLPSEFEDVFKKINTRQRWIIISEPWCGDAAHILPFIMKLLATNPRLSYDIVLRDTPPFLIQSYLTNGSKSIPKVIVRDEAGTDLFTWGPRPQPAQQLFNQLMANHATFEEVKLALQHWYNEDKGLHTLNELTDLVKVHSK